MILHEIVQVQNMSINEIAREIVTLKYDVMKIENNVKNNSAEIRFSNLIQGIFYRITKEKEISNALTDLILKPKPSDVLKIINKDVIIRDLNDLDEKFYPTNKSIKNMQDILEILAVSKISIVKQKDNITIFIDIPFYSENWMLLEMVPILFKGKGENIEIIDTASFMIRDKTRYTLLSANDMGKCKLSGLLYICPFTSLNPIKPTCENSLYMRNEMKYCKTAPTAYSSKIIQINGQTFFINTNERMKITWRCMDSMTENENYISENVWIKLKPGCYFKASNKTYYVSNFESDMELTVPTDNPNLSEEHWKPKYNTVNSNTSNVTNVIHANIDKISTMVNGSYDKANVAVERIKLPIKLISYSVGIFTISCIAITLYCIYHHCIKK